tara:strand:- start:284 stop:673 length:390 start_codon:yes stop_codon:yes gene_type:complete
MFEWFNKTKSNFEKNQFIKFYIDYPRNLIMKRIIKRVNEMFSKGAIKEVKLFLKLKIRKENSSNKVIGIQEISELLKHNIDINEAKERISIKTRQYAKRQSTWARSYMNDWIKIDFNNSNFSNLEKLLS